MTSIKSKMEDNLKKNKMKMEDDLKKNMKMEDDFNKNRRRTNQPKST